MMGALASAWALLGVSAVLGSAIYRLSLVSWEALASPWQWYHWAALVPWVAFMAHSEGYRGFQHGFSPRVAARVAFLRQNPNLLRTVLAPLFAMGYFEIRRRRQIAVYALTCVIVGLIVLVKLLPQPWRGIVDFGVVVGLLWGLITLLIFAVKALRGQLDASPEMPE